MVEDYSMSADNIDFKAGFNIPGVDLPDKPKFKPARVTGQFLNQTNKHRRRIDYRRNSARY